MNREIREQLCGSVLVHVRLRRREDAIYTQWCRKKGISFTKLLVMDLINLEKDGIEPNLLADYAAIQPQTLNGILNVLEKQNYIVRLPHPTDARKKILKLTPEGEAYSDSFLLKMVENDVKSFNVLTREEQALFNAMYTRLVGEMEANYGVRAEKLAY